jgi:hypothetical protein
MPSRSALYYTTKRTSATICCAVVSGGLDAGAALLDGGETIDFSNF